MSDFSVDRFVHDAVVRGERLDAARAAGRHLLADILRARLALVTTDDIRHWILERDPLVFARRRRLREPGADGWRYLDPTLAAIADLAERPWPHGGRLVAELVLDHFRPGAVPVAAQAAPEPEKAPPLADLEEQLGDLADGLEWPEEPDWSRPGDVGDTYPLPPLPDDAEGPKTHAVSAGIDDALRRVRSKEAPACGETFHLHATYFTRVGAPGVDFRAMVRAAILHGIAEAYRVCQPTRCERPVLKVLHACWGSGATEASAHVVLETTCTAS